MQAGPGLEARGAPVLGGGGGGAWAAFRPPVGPGQIPGGGPGTEGPGSSWVLEIFHISTFVIFLLVIIHVHKSNKIIYNFKGRLKTYINPIKTICVAEIYAP